MKKLLHNLLIIFLFLALIACAAEDEIVVVTPDPSLVPFTLPTATFPPLPPTPPLPPPAEHLPLAPPPEIPVIMAEFEASKQGKVIAGLTDPEARRLYALDERGLLLIFNLDDYRQLASVETGLDRRSGGGFYFNQLALDAGRRRLYLSGDPIQILATDTFQLTPQPDLRGQLTPDPASDRLYLTPPCVCQMEQCNTLILNVNTLTSAETLFPPQNPLAAPCVAATSLDSDNQLLYAHINNGVPGANGGFYFSLFDVSAGARPVYTENETSFGPATFDPVQQRLFAPRQRMGLAAIHRYDYQGQTVSPAQTLVGLQGELVYDPVFSRLYAVQDTSLFTFDHDLTLLSEVPLPDRLELLSFDPQGQRLYLADSTGKIKVMTTSGGALQPPPPEPDQTAQAVPQERLVAPDGTEFRIFGERLYRSADSGHTWQILGWGLPARPVSTVAVSPNYKQDRTLLAGLGWLDSGGGLYRSGDGGDTWQPTTRGLTDLAVTAIAFSPTFTQDQTIFVTTRIHGLFRSTDSGETWRGLAVNSAHDPAGMPIAHLALSPTFADDKLLLMSSSTLHRSTDGGAAWTDTGIPGKLIAFSPAFARDRLVLSDGRWRSADGGQTWQAAAGGLASTSVGAKSLAVSPDFASDQTAYLLLEQGFETPPILQRSIDAGRSWQTLLGGLPLEVEIALVTPLPGGELILTTPTGAELTVAAADLAWGRPPVDLTHLDLQGLAIAADGALFVANSAAGVFKSTDGGGAWTETNFPARGGAVELARLAMAENGPLFAAVGPVIARSDDAGGNWTQLSGLPAGFTAASLALSPDFGLEQVVIAGGDYRRNDLIRSTDGGESWQVVFAGGEIEGGSDITALAFSPHFASDGVVYAWLQNSGLLRSTDGGVSWTLLTGDDDRFYAVQSLAVAPDGKRLYLGALDGHFLVSADNGQSWQELGDNIPDQRIWSSAIAFGPAGDIFLGTEIGVYRTLDGGQTWLRASDGLPTRPESSKPQGVRALQFAGGGLYAALTQGGLFTTVTDPVLWSAPAQNQ